MNLSTHRSQEKICCILQLIVAMLLTTINVACRAATKNDDRPVMRFELSTLDSSHFVRLNSFKNRPLLLNFWGSECPACVKEMPLLAAQATKYPQVPFIGIAVDERHKALRFVEQQHLPYLQLSAPKEASALLKRFGNQFNALPYSVMLDSSHKICAVRLGEVDVTWLTAALNACAK